MDNLVLKRLYEDFQGKMFFIVVFISYILLYLFFPLKSVEVLYYFLYLLYKLLWVFVLIVVLMFLINAFVDRKMIRRWFGEGKGIKGWFISIVGGIISSGPIYMWYPLLADLKEKGLKERYIACFLYNRAVKIPLLPLLIFYMGWKVSLLLTIYMIVFSVLNGVLVEAFLDLFDKRNNKINNKISG